MPELPEVEVTRLRLEPAWVGRRITHVFAGPPSYFFLTPPARLVQRLTGRTTRALFRHGKYLWAELDDGGRLLCHLGMTGQLFTCSPKRARTLLAEDPHVHLTLELKKPGSATEVLLFRDARKFGKVQWLSPDEDSPRLAKMGPDALVIDARGLARAFSSRGAAVKTALLDQSLLAGVGNIYADEALFAAGILPTRPARSLALEECQRLVRALRRVLRAAIAAGGSTVSDFLQADGEPGSYQRNHRVYGRAGEACPRCGGAIARIVLGQRSAHFCPRCQD